MSFEEDLNNVKGLYEDAVYEIGDLKQLLRDVNNCIAWSDTQQTWVLLGRERVQPVLQRIRDVVGDCEQEATATDAEIAAALREGLRARRAAERARGNQGVPNFRVGGRRG